MYGVYGSAILKLQVQAPTQGQAGRHIQKNMKPNLYKGDSCLYSGQLGLVTVRNCKAIGALVRTRTPSQATFAQSRPP
jgi:hypothetical protein